LLDGIPVFIISKELLIKNKLAVHRPQDLADLQQIAPDADADKK